MNRFHAPLLLALAGTLAIAAAPASDPLLQRLVTVARATPAAAFAFERTVKATARDKAGAAETHVRTERWDGRELTLLTVDGRPATAAEVAENRKQAKGKPIPGYYRLGLFLGNGARRTTDSQGRTVYRVDALPKGSIDINGDKSDKFAAEALVEAGAAQPYVSRLHIFLKAPLSIMFVASIDSFDVVNEYRLGPGGKPVQASQVQTMAGSQFGKQGQTRTETSYTPLR